MRSRTPTRLLTFARLLALSTLVATGCRTASDNSVSAPEGFSAIADADNAAVLMTAYGSTPGYAGMFEQDLANIKAVMSDPAGNYRFQTALLQRAGHDAMLAQIRAAAAKVSEDGTLMVFITAHGATNGTIQPEGQAYATLGYSHILQAVKDGRQGKPFRRFVLFISACYSGSWLSTLQSSDGLFQERLVMTSVGPNELSMIGSATSAMYSAFKAHKNSPNTTMRQFIGTARSYNQSFLVSAYPETLLDEALLNPGSGEIGGPTGPSPSPDSGTSSGEGDGVPADAKVKALTANSTLYLYSSVANATIEVWSDPESQWLAAPSTYDAQATWPTIRGLSVSERWLTLDSIRMRVRGPGATGAGRVFDVPLTHQ